MRGCRGKKSGAVEKMGIVFRMVELDDEIKSVKHFRRNTAGIGFRMGIGVSCPRLHLYSTAHGRGDIGSPSDAKKRVWKCPCDATEAIQGNRLAAR